MDTDHSQGEILDVTKAFSMKIANSEYTKTARWEILKSATVKYYRDLADWQTGGKAMYRSREEITL